MSRSKAKKREEQIRVWPFAQARAALPYLAGVVQSLREHYLEMQHQKRAVRRLEEQPGRPDRAKLIAREEALREAQLAEDRFQDALAELHALDVYCLDPVQGQALVPFAQGDQLAWYVYDLFDGAELRFWRYHSDPIEMRRPIDESLSMLV